MALVLDHLWQSVLCALLVAVLSRMLSHDSAAPRLWLWRLAALKFLVPFAALYALGTWLGFPVPHSAVAPPAALARAVDVALRVLAPAQEPETTPLLLPIYGVSTCALTATSLWFIRKALITAAVSQREEIARRQGDASLESPPPGFLKTMALAVSALALLVAPVVGGALRDRQSRQALLAMDTASLRSARIELSAVPWRFGDRTRIDATRDGVVIRKINLQDLVALVYGIGQFEVFGGALPWLESPHYDVRVTGSIREPEKFDPYSLRQPVTNYLNAEFGVSIRVNGACQDPCLDQQSFTIERLPWISPFARAPR